MSRSKRKAVRNGEIPQVPFKVATHLGVLRSKVARKEIAVEAVPELLALGQNGGGPTRKERRVPKHLAAKIAKKSVKTGRFARVAL